MADAVVIKIDGDATSFNASLAGIQPATERAMSGMSGSVMRGMASWQLLQKGITMAFNGLTTVFNVGKEFEAAMSEVQTISGASADELQVLEDAARKMGSETAFSASEAAEALKYMALAAWDADQSSAALGGVLALAGASGMSLRSASDSLTDYMTAFGWEAERAEDFANIMVYANNTANTSAEQLSQAYGNCASNMAVANQTVETTTALLMAMANVSDKGASAGTGLNAVMAQLTQKSKDGAITINNRKIALADESGEWKNLITILHEVEAATEGLGSQERADALSSVFSRQSISAINEILNAGLGSVDEYYQQLTGDLTGVAIDAYATMTDNLQGDIDIFKSALQETELVAYDSVNGIARSTTQLGTQMITAVAEAGKKGGIDDMIAELINQVATKTPEITEGFVSMFDKVVLSLSKKLPALVKNLLTKLPNLFNNISSFLPSLLDGVGAALGDVMQYIFGEIPNYAPALIQSVISLLESAFEGVGKAAGQMLRGIFQAFGVEYSRMYEGLGDIGTTLTYTTDTEANVDNSGAQKDVEEAISSFISELSGYGITEEEIMKMLMVDFSTEEELKQYLDSNFPNIPDAAKQAIIEQFNNNGEAWTLGEGNTQIGSTFITQLITSMFTNGKAEDESSVTAMKDAALAYYDQKIADLSAYIAENGDADGSATKALEAFTNVKDATISAIDAMGSMSTEQCRTACSELESLAQAADDAYAQIAGDFEKLISYEESILNLGKNGAKLDKEQLASAFTFINYEESNAIAELKEKQKELISQLAPDDVDGIQAINDWYAEAEAAIKQQSKVSLAELLLGQLSGMEGTENIDAVAALSSVKDQILTAMQSANMGQLTPDDVAEILRENGFSEDIISQAIKLAFGDNYEFASDFTQNLPMVADSLELRNALREQGVINTITSAEQDAIIQEVANELNNGNLSPDNLKKGLEGLNLSDGVMQAVLDAVFSGGDNGNHVINASVLTSMLDGYDFGILGDLVQSAISSGILESSDYEGMSINDIILSMISNSGKSDRVEIPELPNVETGEVEVQPDGVKVDIPDVAEVQVDDKKLIAKGKMVTVEDATVDVTDAKPTEESTAVIEGAAQQAADTVNVTTTASVTANADINIDTGDAASKGNKEGVEIGFNIGAGIVRGLTNTQAWVVASARAMAQAAAEAIKRSFGIASPSKLMKEYGGYIGEGLAIGMEDMSSTVAKRAASMAHSAIAAVEGSVGAMNVGTSAGLTSIANQMNDLNDTVAQGNTYTFSVNGKELAKATASDNNNAINAYSRRIAMGYGRG